MHIESLKPSATLAINERVKKLRAAGSQLCHFGFGQSPFPIHTTIIDALRDHAGDNSYMPSLGLSDLREQLSTYLDHYHGLSFDPQLIFIGPGSKELLFQTVLILDHTFLIPRGSWVSYLPQIRAKGGRYTILETHFEQDYKLRPQALEGYCKKHQGEKFVLILNSPNNPSGAVYSDDELKALSDICRNQDILVLSDEIYSRVCFVGETAPSMASYYPEGTIVYSGLSKIFSAGGYRCGFMAVPASLSHLQPVFQSLFSETFSAVASPVQHAAVRAFTPDPSLDDTIHNNTAFLKTVAEYAYDRLDAKGVGCTNPQGAFYMLIDLSPFTEGLTRLQLFNSEAIAMHLLDACGVALLPGSDFYFEASRPIFRLAFVDFDGADLPPAWQDIPRDDLITQAAPNIVQGVDRLLKFCDELTRLALVKD